MNASVRHLTEGLSILGTGHLQNLMGKVSGSVVMLVSHAHSAKLLQTYAGKDWQKGSFVKDLTSWSAWTLQDLQKDRILLKGIALPGEASASFFKSSNVAEGLNCLHTL